MKLIASLAALIVLAFSATSQAGDAPKPYPLQTCFVTGAKLGEMGPPAILVYEGQEYKFCCKACVKKFQSDPAKYTREFEAARKAGS